MKRRLQKLPFSHAQLLSRSLSLVTRKHYIIWLKNLYRKGREMIVQRKSNDRPFVKINSILHYKWWESAWFFNEQYMIYSRAPGSEDSTASWKIALWSRIVYTIFSNVAYENESQFLYNYFTPLFFESSWSDSINTNNSVLNFYINK
jgi:hypothetical protein